MISCKFENGNEADLRHVVVDAVCIKGGEILLEKRDRKLIHGGKYALPGGFVEHDEKIEQAVLRELREETGYQGEIIKLLRIVDDPDRGDDRQNVTFLYLISVKEKADETDGEATEIKWFGLEDLPEKEEFAFDHYQLIQYYLNEERKA